MPDVEWNKRVWDTHSDWSGRGDEWSGPWGGPHAQWHWSLLPRVAAYVPAAAILEIAPGFGRWTARLKGLCKQLTVVDLSAECIAACKQRFAADTHIEYHVNDGSSLAMVPDKTIDFAFSFDSLVHVELEVMRAYVSQLATKLTADGVAFLHHSNLGEYADAVRRADKLPGKFKLEKLGLVERNPSNRGLTVTAAAVAEIAEKVGLAVPAQELFCWGGSKRFTDAISVFTPAGSKWARPAVVVRNPDAMSAEAARAAVMATCYSPPGG